MSTPAQTRAAKVTITNPVEGYEGVLTKDALTFLATLQLKFGSRRTELLKARTARQTRFDAGELPDFLEETKSVREGDWTVAPIPVALQDRRVEITGPVDRKMMINALNSGAKMFMADFEDASAPTFSNMIEGQVNMQDYANNDLEYTDPRSGKEYSLGDTLATMLVRPRGWHMEEAHVLVDGEPMSASLFDFGVHFFHNGKILADSKRGPFYYLPKLESHLEARLWNDVFTFAQQKCGVDHATIKATVLIETLPGAFEMDEILYELRDHMAGLNCGRWDYIFSYIKTLRANPAYVLPDRAQVGMDRAFLKAYATKVVETCHKRKAHAMGGMAAQIPVKNDEEANNAAYAKVKADKVREVEAGHDGTWVAHPGLVSVAMDVFNELMPNANQIDTPREFLEIGQAELLAPHTGTVTEAGVRTNISVGLEYTAAWLTGRGAVPIHNLMEDAATAEISRSQIWQWLKHGSDVLREDGSTVAMTRDWFDTVYAEEIAKITETLGEEGFKEGLFPQASAVFLETATSETLGTFLTLPAYDVLRTL